MAEELKGTRGQNTASSFGNSLSFVIEQMMNNICTMTPVVVVSVDATGSGGPVGRLTARILVSERSAEGEALQMAELFNIPYFRYQGGNVAVVCDPVPGDKGIAIFSHSDTSNIQTDTNEPVQPGSFRKFDAADGWYVGGFLNKAPETYIEMKQDGTIVLHAPTTVQVESPTVIASGDVIASGISLVNHIHGGVEPGGANTTVPV